MDVSKEMLFFFCALGVFNGFLVSLYFLFFTKQKRVQNHLLGLLLLMLTLRIGKSLYVIFNENRELIYVQIGLTACFLIGVFLYYYLKASIENRKIIPRFWKIHIFILLFIILSVGILKPYETNVNFWRKIFVPFFIYIVWGVYIVISGFVLKDIFKKLFSKNIKCTTSELWLIAVFTANTLIYSAYIVGYFWLYYVGTLTFSFVFYVLLFFLLIKKNRQLIFQDIPEKYASKKIEDSAAESLLKKLKEMVHDKKLYKNPDIKLSDIAKELDISPHQLSQLLNDNLKKSFALFINEYRIEEAQRLLKENHQFTLEAIGFEAGFSSKATFYSTFKKLVGQTPAEFKKQSS